MRRLLFIYNAKSGLINTFFDISHKLLSPETYKCNLCALTHDTFSENKDWKAFRTHNDIDIKFYHKDEFLKDYPNATFCYPSILIEEKNTLREFIYTSEINKLNSVEELIDKIRTAYRLVSI